MSYSLYRGAVERLTKDDIILIDYSNRPVFTLTTTTRSALNENVDETYAILKAESPQIFAAMLLELAQASKVDPAMVLVSDPSMIQIVQEVYPATKVMVPPFYIAAHVIDTLKLDNPAIQELGRWLRDRYRLEVLDEDSGDRSYQGIGIAIAQMQRYWPIWSTVGLVTHMTAEQLESVWDGRMIVQQQTMLDQSLGDRRDWVTLATKWIVDPESLNADLNNAFRRVHNDNRQGHAPICGCGGDDPGGCYGCLWSWCVERKRHSAHFPIAQPPWSIDNYAKHRPLLRTLPTRSPASNVSSMQHRALPVSEDHIQAMLDTKSPQVDLAHVPREMLRRTLPIRSLLLSGTTASTLQVYELLVCETLGLYISVIANRLNPLRFLVSKLHYFRDPFAITDIELAGYTHNIAPTLHHLPLFAVFTTTKTLHQSHLLQAIEDMISPTKIDFLPAQTTICRLGDSKNPISIGADSKHASRRIGRVLRPPLRLYFNVYKPESCRVARADTTLNLNAPPMRAYQPVMQDLYYHLMCAIVQVVTADGDYVFETYVISTSESDEADDDEVTFQVDCQTVGPTSRAEILFEGEQKDQLPQLVVKKGWIHSLCYRRESMPEVEDAELEMACAGREPILWDQPSSDQSGNDPIEIDE